MLSYFGNAIESSSDQMSSAIYENNWIEADIEYKRNLIMAMASVNNRIKLKVGKIFAMNLPNFLFVGLEKILNF